MAEDYLKEDPLRKPKKITFAIFVGGLVVLSILTFASFHWLYSDYFTYFANKEDAVKHLADIRGQAKVELDRIDAAQQSSLKQIAVEEQKASQRMKDLETQHTNRIANLDVEYKTKRDQLMQNLDRKKIDLADVVRNYKELFGKKTNEYETVIAELVGRKNAIQGEIEVLAKKLPEVRKEFQKASNDLVVVTGSLDARKMTLQSYEGKIGSLKGTLSEMMANKDALSSELKQLSKSTTDAKVALKEAEGQLNVLTSQDLLSARQQLQAASNEVKRVGSLLSSLKDDVAKYEGEKKEAELAKENAVAARDAALDKKREAESFRDKATAEKELAEKTADDRKKELASLIADEQKRLEDLRKQVKDLEKAKKAISSEGKPVQNVEDNQ